MTDLRILHHDEWKHWFESMELAFGGAGETAEHRAFWDSVTDLERCMGLWDGDQCVGTAGAFSFRLSVPGGGLVPAAGVSMVSVTATHRRGGLLTTMMRRQLDDVRERGEAIAALTASEPDIYGRFGYGAATRQLRAEIDTTRVRVAHLPPGTDGITLRRASVTDPAVRHVLESLYELDVPGRPGMLARQPGWERLPLLDPQEDRKGASPLQCVLAERRQEAVGFVLFHTAAASDLAGPRGVVRLRELYARDPAPYAALWRFLFGIDLMSKVVAPNRPVDDAFQHLVSDIRRCELRVRDALYVRPVEVGAALAARTYRAPVDVVLDMEDAFCPWNEGRWRLSGDRKGASCERTGDAADLALSARELGAAYLGGVSLTELAAAGRVAELRPGALAEASLAFGSDRAPWLPHPF